MTNQQERIVGGLLGLALGDALGAPFEFRRADEIPNPIPEFSLPWRGYPAGTWTDDTAMALSLADSLIDNDGDLVARDIAGRHVEWLLSDPPDVGILTRTVLSWWQAGVAEPALRYLRERGPEVSAGNGSVMYCAPLGLVRAENRVRLLKDAPALSTVTHADPRCQTACLCVTYAAAALVAGEDARDAVVDAVGACEGLEGKDELEELIDGAGIARPIDGPDQGFCFFTAGVAMRIAVTAGSFEEGILEVIALGGDTDTNAAVTGALLGARFGRDAPPSGWLDKLGERDRVEETAEKLAALASAGSAGEP